MLLRFWGQHIFETAGSFMQHQLGTVNALAVDRADAISLSQSMLDTFGKALLPVLGLLALAGVLTSIFQTGFLFVPDRLMPDISRLSPLSGLKRILSLSGAVKLGFGMFKVGIVLDRRCNNSLFTSRRGSVCWLAPHQRIGSVDDRHRTFNSPLGRRGLVHLGRLRLCLSKVEARTRSENDPTRSS